MECIFRTFFNQIKSSYIQLILHACQTLQKTRSEKRTITAATSKIMNNLNFVWGFAEFRIVNSTDWNVSVKATHNLMLKETTNRSMQPLQITHNRNNKPIALAMSLSYNPLPYDQLHLLLISHFVIDICQICMNVSICIN